jgi:pilus assembly protein CpaE
VPRAEGAPRIERQRRRGGWRWRVRCRAGDLLRRHDGVSAVEFALIGPMLVFALLAMVDLGVTAIHRLEVDHVLRAGAEIAIVGEDSGAIEAVLKATARETFKVAGDPDVVDADDPISVTVALLCACDQTTVTPVDCNSLCSGPAPPLIFYELGAEKRVSRLVLSSAPIDRSLLVQVR